MTQEILARSDEPWWHYLHFGWWPGEAPLEPDDLRDCARDAKDHYDARCPYCKRQARITDTAEAGR